MPESKKDSQAEARDRKADEVVQTLLSTRIICEQILAQ